MSVSPNNAINNRFYDDLGDRWYQDDYHPVALLRAESRQKLLYLEKVFASEGIEKSARILDIGCGAGLIANPLAAKGHQIKGIDLSASSVATAVRFAPRNGAATYAEGNAYELKEDDRTYDIVLMLDFLEHVDEPQRAIHEASRVLKPGGLFIYHTFNRTLLAYLLVIKAVEMISQDCPDHMHVYHLFIKPSELQVMAAKANLTVKDVKGIRPKIFARHFWWSVLNRRVHPDFQFTLVRSLGVGYIGYAFKALK